MKVQITYYGMLAELVARTEEEMQMASHSTTTDLKDELYTKYPQLVSTSFKIAINNTLVTGTSALQSNMQIALLPPFAGG